MESFQTFRGRLAVLERANIDTDQIIPKQFLKSIKRTGFGENLFYDWRYLADGKLNPEFPLNDTRARGAQILVAGNNFGCGSSREHAVWAIQQAGFKAVIAPWQERDGTRVPAFADIFRNNAAKNSLLAIELSGPEVDKIFQWAGRIPQLEATVNLEEQRVTLHLDEEISFHFEIEAGVKTRLIRGLDEVGLILKEEKTITAFERKHNAQLYS